MDRETAIWYRATEMTRCVVDFDYIDGALLVQINDEQVLLAESKGGKYVYEGQWFLMCDCSDYWKALVEILLGVRKPAPIPPMDIHEQAHDDW